MRNQIRTRFGLWVAVTQGYMCTKFEVNSISGYKTCHLFQLAMPMTDFDLCDLEIKVKSKTQKMCDVSFLGLPTIKISASCDHY